MFEIMQLKAENLHLRF